MKHVPWLAERFVKLLKKPAITVPQAGEIFSLCRNAAYEAAKRGDFEVLKFGKRIMVPTAPLRKRLGLDENQ